MWVKKDINTASVAQALVIGKKGANQLSKQQQTFNRLNQKIKKLRAEIKDFIAFSDDCLTYYSAHIYPLEQRSTMLRTELVKLLYPVYCNNKLVSKGDRKILKQVILKQIDDIFYATENHADELKAIFNTLSGEDYDQVAQSGFEESRNEMEQMFASMGMDIDMSSIEKDDDMATAMHKIHEQLEKAKLEQGSKQTAEKKTKRELARETKEKTLEAVRELSIKNIYKQLVKALHPDLERDENLRIEKEALMQELTNAYKNNDLHTLLKLELSWIQHESDHLETLTDDKLKIYNQLLKEQVQDLETELTMIGHHPRYMPLERFYYNDYLKKQSLEAEPYRLKEIVTSVENSIYNLKNGKVKHELDEIFATYRFALKFAERFPD